MSGSLLVGIAGIDCFGKVYITAMIAEDLTQLGIKVANINLTVGYICLINDVMEIIHLSISMSMLYASTKCFDN